LSDVQALAASRATPGNDFASILGIHPGKKAVLSFSFYFFRLPGLGKRFGHGENY